MKKRTVLAALAAVVIVLLVAMVVVVRRPAVDEADPGPRSSNGCGGSSPAVPGETGTLSMAVDGLEREYRLHLPPGYDQNIPTSLVLVFHGYTMTAEGTELGTMQMSPHADEHGYIVVYPQATSFVSDSGDTIASWNDLSCNASPGPQGPICSENAYQYPFPPECGEPSDCNWCACRDDLAFVDALLDELENTLCIDLDRVYATGMSNGGMFVHRLGCAMADRFAAIAPVSGALAKGFNCAPGSSTPISIMNIYGSRDNYVPADGSPSFDGYFYTSAADVMDAWASADSQDCAAVESPYPTAEDGTRQLECTQRADCATGAEIVSCAWAGGHNWPRAGDAHFGNNIIWEFFSKNGK